MKKLILIFGLIYSSISYSQIAVIETKSPIEIGRVSNMGHFAISLSKLDDTYIFTYKDVTYQQITELKSFEFKETGNDLETLYQEIIKGIENQPKEHVTIKLPEGYLFLRYGKTMGIKYVEIGHSLYDSGQVIGFCRGLSKKEVNKLFGK